MTNRKKYLTCQLLSMLDHCKKDIQFLRKMGCETVVASSIEFPYDRATQVVQQGHE